MEKYQYRGILAQKRKPERFARQAKLKAALKIAYDSDTEARIDALFENCAAGTFDPDLDKGLGGVQRGWRTVALALAERHVPGFQVGRGRGRPSKSFPKQLLQEVSAAQKRQKKSNKSAAARAVAKKLGLSASGVQRKVRRLKNDK